MQYKNIIFDLGNVLVKLNPEGCIGASSMGIDVTKVTLLP